MAHPQPQGIPAPLNSDPLFTIPETMDYLRVSRHLLHAETSAGRIAPTRIGSSVRYRRSEVERYLSAQTGGDKR